jgi:hypothetical protein
MIESKIAIGFAPIIARSLMVIRLPQAILNIPVSLLDAAKILALTASFT